MWLPRDAVWYRGYCARGTMPSASQDCEPGQPVRRLIMAQKLWRPIRRIVDAVRARREAVRARREDERARREAVRVRREDERARREDERARREDERARREDERARRRKLRQHWSTLSGIEFEREMGALFSDFGYTVESTPSSGDQGIDLILRKNGETTLVQCKSRKSPIGPAVARELLGSLVAFPGGADKAILACTGGFTKGVYEFVQDQPTKLIDASDIVTLSESVYVPNWDWAIHR